MNLTQAYEKVKQTFFQAISINSVNEIRQDGVYLVFSGTRNTSPNKDLASFALILAAHSLEKDNFKALKQLEQMREELFDLGCVEGKNYFKEIKQAVFEGSTLYIYAVLFDMEIIVKNT